MSSTAWVATVLALSFAPMQCSRDPDPATRREDTAGDALWGLAERFHAKHDESARMETLRFLVERYPSNRHVPAAKVILRERADAP